MRALYTAAIVHCLFFTAFGYASDYETEICDSYKSDELNKNVAKSDCEFVKEDRENFIRCVVPMMSTAPTDSQEGLYSEASDRDNDTAAQNVTVYIDYGFKIAMYSTEKMKESEREVDRCLRVISVSLKRLWEVDGKERKSFPLASRLFNVVANAEMLSSDVELAVPVFAGKAKLERSCFDPGKRDYSSCIIDVDISVASMVPGSDDELGKGVVDFDIQSFGYSHVSALSYLRSEDEFHVLPSFPDRTRMGKILLRHLPGANITSLKLPKNKWTTLDNTDIQSLPKLEILDLSKNSFGKFETDAFRDSFLLRELNFSESRLKTIPSFISTQNYLEVLNLGGNVFIYDQDAGAAALFTYISNLTQIESLNISGFVTKYFAHNTLPPLPHLRQLDASRCGILDIEGNAFVNLLALEKIDLSGNVLNTLPHGLFERLDHLKYVDLSSNKITDGQGFRFSPKASVVLLDMSSNSMSSAEDLIALESSVKRINLADNVLKDLDKMRLNIYGKWAIVEELDISSNLIPALSFEACQTISTLKKINLTENQFNCDNCNLLDFQRCLNNTDPAIFTSPPEDLMCAAPPLARKRKLRVIEASYNEDCIGPDVTIVVGGTFSGLALVAALVSGVLYIYRFEAAYVLHLIRVKRRSNKGEGKPHDECIYDAFVSYSGHDRNWVLRVLQPELEEGEQKYQLCLHDRNFTLGGIITQNIVDSIDKSRKTILILSKGFVDSQWCRWEMEMANHKLFNDQRDFLVLVELERLERKNLPRHLRYLMDTRTYLEWPSPATDIVPLSSNQNSSEIVLKSSSSKSDIAGVQEQSVSVFWKRFREALGDSLYTKEMKARQAAEIEIKKSKERDTGVTTVYRRTVERPPEEMAL